MAARRGRKATEELKRGDSDVESSLLQPEKLTVDERQATVVVESQSVDVGVWLYGSSNVNTLVARRRDTSQLCRLTALMPRLSDDEDVQLFVDDGPTQRRGLVAYRARVDAAERQTSSSTGRRTSAKRSPRPSGSV